MDNIDSAAPAPPAPVMFTLCMSRGPSPLQGSQQQNSLHKQVKGGYLLRYRRGFFCRGWCEEWVVLYDDSTIAWYAEKGLSRPRGYVRIKDAPEFLAVGEWTRTVPRRPRFARSCRIQQLMAFGESHRNVHWLMAKSPAEVNDWMTAISNTLPPPPHLSINGKPRLSLTFHHPLDQLVTQNKSLSKNHNPINDADHTILSGVAIDWGHGWGWGHTAWATHAACSHESVPNTSLHYVGEDYTAGGYDEVDWSTFGDFCF